MFFSKVPHDFIESIIYILISGSALLYIRYKNRYFDADRYYYRKHKDLYYLMKICYMVIIITLALNARYLIYLIFQKSMIYAVDSLKRV